MTDQNHLIELTNEALDKLYALENALLSDSKDEVRANEIRRMVNRLRDMRDDLTERA
jgi:stalled ribosome rescue protein Dom34